MIRTVAVAVLVALAGMNAVLLLLHDYKVCAAALIAAMAFFVGGYLKVFD